MFLNTLTSLGGLGRHNLLAVLVVADTGGRGTVAAADARADAGNIVSALHSFLLDLREKWMGERGSFVRVCSRRTAQGSSEAPARPHWEGAQSSLPGTNVPDNLAVNGARDAVLQLQVHLGHGVLREDGGIRDVTCKGHNC